MSELKITFFKDRKLSLNKRAALLEFSTGETKVACPTYEFDLGYYISKAIFEVSNKHKESELFEKLQ